MAGGIDESSNNQFALSSKLFSVTFVKDYTDIRKWMIDDYGQKVCTKVKTLYPIRNGIPRIVGGETV